MASKNHVKHETSEWTVKIKPPLDGPSNQPHLPYARTKRLRKLSPALHFQKQQSSASENYARKSKDRESGYMSFNASAHDESSYLLSSEPDSPPLSPAESTEQYIDIITELDTGEVRASPALDHIFTYLSGQDLATCSCVSKSWKRIIYHHTMANEKRLEYVSSMATLRESVGPENWPIKKEKKRKHRNAFETITNVIGHGDGVDSESTDDHLELTNPPSQPQSSSNLNFGSTTNTIQSQNSKAVPSKIPVPLPVSKRNSCHICGVSIMSTISDSNLIPKEQREVNNNSSNAQTVITKIHCVKCQPSRSRQLSTGLHNKTTSVKSPSKILKKKTLTVNEG